MLKGEPFFLNRSGTRGVGIEWEIASSIKAITNETLHHAALGRLCLASPERSTEVRVWFPQGDFVRVRFLNYKCWFQC